MDDALSRRNLGPSEYWGRVIEQRLSSSEKVWGSATSSLSGIGRNTDAVNAELSRQIEGIRESLQQLKDALLVVPTANSAAQQASGFSLAPGWNTILNFNVPIIGDKTTLNVIADGRVTVRDDGPTGGGGGPGYFQWPFPLQYVTSEYGFRPGGFHSGMDFAGGPASSGSPIFAPADGVVLSKGTDGSRGNYINLRHEPGLITRYFHMISSSPLSAGTPVTKGVTIIGYVGNTGSSFGAHLHWETYIEGGPLNEENYPAMNPRDFMGIYGTETSTPVSGEYSDIRARVVIAGNSSLEYQPFKILNSNSEPNFVQNFLYPIHGLRYTGNSVPVRLEIYSSADVPGDGFNTASLDAFGIFA